MYTICSHFKNTFQVNHQFLKGFLTKKNYFLVKKRLKTQLNNIFIVILKKIEKGTNVYNL